MPTKQSKQVIYWDTCIFLAWLKNETWRPNHEMDGVYDAVDAVKTRRAIMMTAATTYGEIRKTKHEHVWRAFESFMKRRNVRMVDVDPRIHALAAQLRDHYRTAHKSDGLGELKVMDSEHLAAAIRYKANMFYTFDNGQKGDRGLLQLNGNVAGHKLVVCKPPVTRISLFTSV
jgi:predicted nucleic acid-binding protein